MANDVTICITGNLVDDPSLRFAPSGGAVANFTIASTPRSFDKQSNEWKDGQALFLRCSIWREAAEQVAESLTKGMRVIAQGRLTQHSWEDEQHQKRTAVELQVDEIGPSLKYATAQVQKMQSGGYQGNANGGYQQPQQAQQQSQAPADDPWGAPAGGPDF